MLFPVVFHREHQVLPPHIEEVLGTAIGPGDRNLRLWPWEILGDQHQSDPCFLGRLPARVAEVQGSFQLTKPPAVSMFPGQRQDFVGDESRCHAERVEPRDGIIEPPAASEVECRTCRGGDRQSVDGVDLIGKNQVVASDDSARRSGIRPDQLDRGVVRNPLRAQQA